MGHGRAAFVLSLLALLDLCGACEATSSTKTLGQAAQPAEAAASTNPSKPLSTRVVAYQIDARLDPEKKTVDATETLTYHNLTGQPLQTFPFHLYLNAFQPRSTFMSEVRDIGTRGAGPEAGWSPKHYGAIEVQSLAVDGAGDLTRQMQFTQPDDHDPDDHTVFQVTLPKPVPPNGEVIFRMAFRDQLPEIVERTGYKRNFFMVAQWFPKIGVWWHGAWNCHQFHATTEFFADFGVYDVKVTVPRNDLVGAAGDEVASEDNPDGTRTITYHAEDTHDFSWAASPDFTDLEDSWTGPGGPVKIHLLISPGHLGQAGRYLQSLKGALDTFDRRYGAYPYDRLTLVDPPQGAIEAGGMEYPTLITGGTAWWEPRGLRLTELVTEHEFGHQYWYAVVATNEFEEAWLDEGINSYTEVKVMSALYGSGRSLVDFWGATADDAGEQRLAYLSTPDTDPLTRFAYQFMNAASYGDTTYGKTAVVLLTLEGIIGEETLRSALHTYYQRYRFTHPTGADFLTTVQEVSGQDLSWYFDQAVSGTKVLDYEVLDIRSDRADWYEKHPRATGPVLYRDTVLVHRKGDFIFPAETAVRFDDGENVREKWDGRDRWVRYTYLKKAKVVSAEVDPDHKVALDRDFFNNSRTAAAHSGAARKLEVYSLFLTQIFFQLLAWLV